MSPAGTLDELAPVFSWLVVSGADHYDLQIDDRTTGQESVVSTRIAHVTQWQLDQQLLSGHSFRWKLRALSGNDFGNWSVWQEFDIQ